MSHTHCERCELEDDENCSVFISDGYSRRHILLCPTCRDEYRHLIVREEEEEDDDEYEQVEEEIYEVEDPISLVIKDAEADGSGDPE